MCMREAANITPLCADICMSKHMQHTLFGRVMPAIDDQPEFVWYKMTCIVVVHVQVMYCMYTACILHTIHSSTCHHKTTTTNNTCCSYLVPKQYTTETHRTGSIVQCPPTPCRHKHRCKPSKQYVDEVGGC